MIELPLREIQAKVIFTEAELANMKRFGGLADTVNIEVRRSLADRGASGPIKVTKLLLPTGTQITWTATQPYTDGVLRWE
jgi:hypothetical protein